MSYVYGRTVQKNYRELVEIESSISGLIDDWNAVAESLRPPSGFNIPTQFSNIRVVKSGGLFTANITASDVVSLADFTDTLYVNSEVTSSGDGLGWDTAIRSMSDAVDLAISSGNKTKIFVKSGDYNRFNSVCGTGTKKTLTNDIVLIACYGRVQTGNYTPLSWTKTAGQDFVYQSARSAVLNATNPSINGNPNLKRVGSVADCNSTPNTFYTDNVDVYVHTFGSGIPNNDNTKIHLATTENAWFTGNYNIYIYGFDFLGGVNGAIRIDGGTDNTVVFENSSFKCAIGGNDISGLLERDGARILNCGSLYAFNCEFSYNSKDGLNAHKSNNIIPSILSVNNRGYDNGLIKSVSSANGFTTHGGIKSIDIGSEWIGSAGTNSGHIHDDTENWSVGVTAGNSDGDFATGGLWWGAFGLWDSANGKMFLSYCKDRGSSVGVYNAGGSTIELYKHNGTGSKIGNVIDV